MPTKAVSAKERKAHVWAKHPDDYYVEPTWVDHRLFDDVPFANSRILDPACGSGRIVRAALARGYDAFGTDIKKRYSEATVLDFFDKSFPLFWRNMRRPHIVSNPPFSKSLEFVQRCLQITGGDVTVLLPIGWICGDDRSRWLEKTPLARVLFITPRPSMPPGTVIDAGGKVGGGWCDFAWYLWRRGHRGEPRMGWLRREK